MSPRTKDQYSEIRKVSREKILSAALELFAKKGFHATSIFQIAKKAKISKGLMYNYFKSKDKLLDEIIQNGFTELEGLSYHSTKTASPEEQLKSYVSAVLDNLYANFAYWQLYLALLVHPDIQKRYEKKLKVFRDKYISQFSKLFRKLGLKDPKLEAFLLGTYFDGLVLNFIAAEADFPVEEIKNALLSKYIRDSYPKSKRKSR
ncbi:TetR/AcrR family transcriptional regulator [bacterium BMS3Abin03]|jgi:AcrR family transcriptional regulator|nr:TetR/AcrR family transcriptional regulator [bacterium BMS3Abin03]